MNMLSSCDCVENNNTNSITAFKSLQKPSNCNFSSLFDCSDTIKLKQQIEPMYQSGFSYLNPTCISNAYARDFFGVSCPSNTPSTCSKGYTSSDPRLISSMHQGQTLILDRPPTDQSMLLKDIYIDPHMREYGKKYSGYSDIKAGDIMYYIDKERQNALSSPNFTIPANVETSLYSNPMNGVWPIYERQPIFDNNVLDTKNRTYFTGLSSLDDSTEFRESLMNLQMRKQNRKRYEPRWS